MRYITTRIEQKARASKEEESAMLQRQPVDEAMHHPLDQQLNAVSSSSKPCQI
jgi:hypothetical protein